MNRHLHSPTKLTEFARDFEEEPETLFSKFVNKITNAYNTSYNTVNELPISAGNPSTSSITIPSLILSGNSSISSSNSSSSSSNDNKTFASSINQNNLNSDNNSNNINNNNNNGNNLINENNQQNLILRTNSNSSVNSSKQFANNSNISGNINLNVTSVTDKSTSDSLGSTSEDTSESTEKYDDLPIGNNEGRTMVNVLKRISNIIVAAKYNNNLKNYKDTELHRYWMPDSTAKQCYECCQKFSAFRRKHHCRLCGQIFCSKCCNQVVPGKIIMCSGSLKVCTYCSKIVLSYLKSSDITLDLKADLQALQDDLSNKFQQNPEQNLQHTNENQNNSNMMICSSAKRKISVGYQEERLVSNQSSKNFSVIDRRNILQQSNSLKALHDEMIQLLPIQNSGVELINYLIKTQKSSNKIQAIAILNAMLEAGFLSPIVPDSDQIEFDENLHYKLIRKNDILRQSGNIQLNVDYESSSVHMSRSMQDDMGVMCDNDFQPFKSIEESLSFQSVKEIEMENSMRSTTTTTSQLVKAYCDHEELLLSQMLRNLNLDQSWSKILIPLCARAANQFRPEYCTNDLMDIRNYVNFKKVPGGLRNDCTIIGGIVFSKNVAHKEMAKKVDRPRILLLQCPIVYERVEGKFVSIETLILQEKEYLKNVTTRILSLKPNVVLVHKNVAGIAQEMLRSHGITLVLDVKVSVMERLARCLQCDIVTSIESNIGKPKLGLCDMFYIKNFDDGNGSCKTLMFFEMLSSPRGCCCLLRGASNNELARVKKVASMLLYARYNWRLEMSFLLEEFARPPSPKPLIFDSKEHSPSSDCEDNVKTTTKSIFVENTANEFENQQNSNVKCERDDNQTLTQDNVSNLSNHSKKLTERKSEEKLITIEDVKDFTDPLRAPELSPTKLETDNLIVEFAVQTPYDNRFRTALSSTVLSISPFVSFPLPYLETEQGRKCPLRSLFPIELYFSKQFSSLTSTEKSTVPHLDHIHDDKNNEQIVNLKPSHDFVKHKITKPIDNLEIQTLLAEFRANGGRYPKTNKMVKVVKKLERYQQPQKATEDFLYKDALNLENHQRLPVLFCSFYYNPKTASSFCAQPTLLEMKFYGQHDIMLGQFLQRYCFRSSYICQSCNLPMMDHVRRYVHSMGCVQVFLTEDNTKNDSDKIFLTSRCSYCNEMTPNVPISPDTCCLSFAKYLELRFHGHPYKKRVVDFTENTAGHEQNRQQQQQQQPQSQQQQNSQKCNHSLHRDYIHYFSYKGIGAKFIYTPIEVWEISIPPLILHLNKPKPFDIKQVLEDIKNFSVKGHEVYSKIYERIAELATEDETPMLSSLKSILNRDQFLFRQHVEIVQTLLTEKSINSYDINDAMIMAKRALADSIELWGPRLHEAAKTIQKQESASHIDAGTICTEDLNSDTSESPSVERKQQQQNHQQQVGAVTATVSTSALATTTNVNINSSSNGNITDDSSHKQDSASSVPTEDNSSGKTKEISSKPSQEHIVSDKKSIKQLLSQLLPSISQVNSLQSPLSSNEHLTLPLGAFPVLVHDQDLSSLIAYSLISNEYKKAIENLNSTSGSTINDNVNSNNSPNLKRKSNDGLIDGNDEKDTNNKNEEDKKSKANHIELYFQDLTTQFTCKIYFAKEFDAMRANILKPPKIEKSLYKELELSKKREEMRLMSKNMTTVSNMNVSNKSGNENIISSSSMPSTATDLPSSNQQQQQQQQQYQNQQQTDIDETRTFLARSLCRSVQWEARGGKSGSKFSKTLDDRFILKEMTKNDVTKFEEDIAPNYFEYINKCLQQNQPTLLVKILGVFRVSVKKKDSIIEKSLLVMENLFYNCDIKNKFDLKGSERNRLVDPTSQNGEIVLLDENLIQMSWSNPLYILSYSKTILREAINRDTSFLERNDVMDYSLLVGLDNKDKVLVLGIIDYIRTYTIDKRIESIVKQSGLLGGQGKLPTVISPTRYKQRFIEAMDRYFYSVPDRWEGLSKK